MVIWRLAKAHHPALDGEGARRRGARWNPRGIAIVYAASTLSLAVLEVLVHTDISDAPEDLLATPIEVPEDIHHEEIAVTSLQRNWRETPAPDRLQAIGLEWKKRGKSALLAVPSVVIPTEQNWLLDPDHPDFKKLVPGKSQQFHFDPRLWNPRP